jgi:hypothetical protein
MTQSSILVFDLFQDLRWRTNESIGLSHLWSNKVSDDLEPYLFYRIPEFAIVVVLDSG